MASGSSLEIGVRLVRQAVLQDSKHNYEEASRCYKEAIRSFNDYINTSNQSSDLLNILGSRVKEYEQRARTIDSYLLEQTDLRKLLRDLDVSSVVDECCGSSTSSTSTTTRQLYKNPQLVEPLDCLRRGRRADEAGDYRGALAFYEYGVGQLFAVLNTGTLTQRQEERARERCLFYHERAQIIRQRLDEGRRGVRGGYVCTSSLSLDSEGVGQASTPETDQLLEMSEVQSCYSNLGSRQTLNQSFEERPPPEVTTASRRSEVTEVVCKGVIDPDMDQSFELKPLDRTHATLHCSLPALCHAAPTDSLKSTHSLFLDKEANRSCWIVPGTVPDVHQQNQVTRLAARASRGSKVPLADIDQELCLSTGSLTSVNSTSSSVHSLGKDRSYTYLEVKLGADTNDTIESELVNLSNSCSNIKDDDTGSDSGYSDPSPDVILRSSADDEDSRKCSPFDYTGGLALDDMERTGLVRPLLTDVTAQKAEIFPRVIIQHDGRQFAAPQDPFGRDMDDPDFRRHYIQKQRSLFQNPEKDILISQTSRDNLAVLSADCLDSSTLLEDETDEAKQNGGNRRVSSSEARPLLVDGEPIVQPEVYGRYLGRYDPIPSRALARRKEDDIKKDGCFYLAAALDFCWCL